MCFGSVGLFAADMAKYQAIRCASSLVKKSHFSTTVKAERTDFPLEPVSLSFRHARISFPVRGFWEPLHFLNFFSTNQVFALLLLLLSSSTPVLTGSFELKSEWRQVSSGLKDFSKYFS